MKVYGIYDDDGETTWLIQVFSRPEKALKLLNEYAENNTIGRMYIREISVDEKKFEEKTLDIRGCKFKIVTQKLNDHRQPIGSPSEIMNNVTREEVLKIYLNAGITLESNCPGEVNGKKTHENFPTDYFWGIPTEWEYGTMEQT